MDCGALPSPKSRATNLGGAHRGNPRMQRPRIGAGRWGRVTSGLPPDTSTTTKQSEIRYSQPVGFCKGKMLYRPSLMTDTEQEIQQASDRTVFIYSNEDIVSVCSAIKCITKGNQLPPNTVIHTHTHSCTYSRWRNYDVSMM